MDAPADLLRLCAVTDLDEDEPLRVDAGGTAYAVFQLGADYHVTEDLCSHGPGSLSEGFLVGCEVAIRVWEAVVREGEIFIAAGSPKGA